MWFHDSNSWLYLSFWAIHKNLCLTAGSRCLLLELRIIWSFNFSFTNFFRSNKPSHQFSASVFPFLWRCPQTVFSLSKVFSMSGRLRLTLFFSVRAPFVILQAAHYQKQRTCHSFLCRLFKKVFQHLLPYPFPVQSSSPCVEGQSDAPNRAQLWSKHRVYVRVCI